ncbi:hypothetical protein [uncultured Muribaculum sp.]|uniref:hypothetical protein n=1 Tax=uncultured Muribaculum sp. TaxID=1918613 RepID=UPI002730F2C9|nr:hypothetical protein [uncultured Muribaculum sp.]
MSKEAVYRFVLEQKIGKRKDKCKVFYSRRQFDMTRRWVLSLRWCRNATPCRKLLRGIT